MSRDHFGAGQSFVPHRNRHSVYLGRVNVLKEPLPSYTIGLSRQNGDLIGSSLKA